jgi:hypothetical protein
MDWEVLDRNQIRVDRAQASARFPNPTSVDGFVQAKIEELAYNDGESDDVTPPQSRVRGYLAYLQYGVGVVWVMFTFIEVGRKQRMLVLYIASDRLGHGRPKLPSKDIRDTAITRLRRSGW